MKERADVVVIGAGIVGCSAAHYLTLAGVRNVVVIDQGPIGDTGGSSFHAPGLCFQTNGSKLSCTLAQWSSASSTASSTRPSGAPGGRSARSRWRRRPSASARSSAATPTPPRGASRATSSRPDEAVAPHPAARSRAAARRAARAERRHRQGRQHLPGAAGARRGARRDVHRLARARPASTWPAGACAPSRPTRAPSSPRRRSSRSASGRPSSCARSACRSSRCSRCSTSSPGRSRCPSWPARRVEIEHPILRHQDRAMYFRQRGEGYGIGAYGHDADHDRAARARAPSRRPPDRDRPVLRGALARVARAGRTSCCRRSPDVGIAETFNGHFSFAVDNNSFAGPSTEVAGLWLADGIWVTHGGGTAKAVVDLMTTGRCALDLGPMHPDRLHQFQRSPLYVKARGRTQYDEVYDIIHPGQVLAHPRGVRTTPWHERFLDHGAELTESAGWERGQWFRANDALPLPRRHAGAHGLGAAALVAHDRPRAPGHAHRRRRLRPHAVRQGRGRGARRDRLAQPRVRERDGPPGRAHPLHDGARPRRRLRLRPHRHAPGRRALPARDRRRLRAARRRLAAQRAARGRLRPPARRVVVARRARALGAALARGACAHQPRRPLVPVPQAREIWVGSGAGARAAHLVRGRARLGAVHADRARPLPLGPALRRRRRRSASWPAAPARSTRCAWRRATASPAST